MSLQDYAEEWRNWISLAVIDEIASRREISDSAYDSLKLVLDCREGKPLLLFSNMNLDEIGGLYDDRIASRMAAGTVVSLTGADQRIEGRTNV